MTVLAHVRPLRFPRMADLESMLHAASQLLLDLDLVREGELIVFVTGIPIGVAPAANALKLHRIVNSNPDASE